MTMKGKKKIKEMVTFQFWQHWNKNACRKFFLKINLVRPTCIDTIDYKYTFTIPRTDLHTCTC